MVVQLLNLDFPVELLLTNAVSDFAERNPSNAVRREFCVTRTTEGFYEWQKPQTPKGAKQPYYIHWAGDEPRVFAGLWESWNDPDGVELLTFTIITTAANDVMKPVHDRMPVILSRPEAEQWLSADTSPDDVHALLRPCPEDWLTVRKVGTLVNSPRNDRPECVAPMD